MQTIQELPKAEMVAGHRYRTPAGVIYPSVTTVLGATKPAEAVNGIKAWRDTVGADVADYIVREAATIGTQVHELNEAFLVMRGVGPLPERDFIHNDGSTPRLLSWAHYENFRPHLDRIGRPVGTEVPMFSDYLRVAGTADCIAEYDGIMSILDYKTKRSPQREEWMTDYYMQTAAYAMMFREHTGIEIKQCVILASSEQYTMQEFRSDPRDYADKFTGRLATYDVRCRAEQDAEWRYLYGPNV